MRSWRGLALGLVLAAACTAAPASEPSPGPTTPEPTAGALSPVPSPDPTAAPVTEAGAGSGSGRTRFAGRIRSLPEPLAAEMRGTTWKPGCPVPLEDLRLLRFNYYGFDGGIKRGPMIVNERVAEDVLWVFEQLFDSGFQIKRIALAKEFRPERYEDAPRRITSHRSVTAAFNCRPVILPTGPIDRYSQHSYGWAIDLNPLQNPFVTADGFVRNRVAERYVDRSQDLQGMIHEGDVVVRSFAAIGWSWGGRWSSPDYMHFSLTDR